MVESLESRILIGREPLPKIFKGGTLTIENLCQLMNFGLILLDGGCHIFIGPSGRPVIGAEPQERVERGYKADV